MCNWKTNRPKTLQSSPRPLYQNEVKCSAFDIEMIHSHANGTHFHKERCALGLRLKVRTRKWPITVSPNVGNKSFFILYSQEI